MQLRWKGLQSLLLIGIFSNGQKSHLEQKFCTEYGAEGGSGVQKSLLDFRFQDAVDILNLRRHYRANKTDGSLFSIGLSDCVDEMTMIEMVL